MVVKMEEIIRKKSEKSTRLAELGYGIEKLGKMG